MEFCIANEGDSEREGADFKYPSKKVLRRSLHGKIDVYLEKYIHMYIL